MGLDGLNPNLPHFLRWGAQPPYFCRIINVFLLFSHGQLLRTLKQFLYKTLIAIFASFQNRVLFRMLAVFSNGFFYRITVKCFQGRFWQF